MRNNISFFCPAYNEEDNIEKVIFSAIKVLEIIADDYEIIIVNNGSTDQTGYIADRLASQNKNIKVIHHHRNMEYGGALKSGFLAAKNEVVVYTDSDNQYDIEDLEKMFPLLDTYDVVTGYRNSRSDSLYRKVQSKIFNFLVDFLFGIRLKDINCSFKIYKKEVLDQITIESLSAFIDAEMLFKAKKKGFKIGEIPVQHYPRLAGTSTGARPKTIFITFKDMVKQWLKLRSRPRTTCSLHDSVG